MTINDINIDIEYKNIKNLHISVYPPDGRVHISAPKGLSEERIRFYVLRKWSWITQKRERLSDFKIQPPREYVSGECHYFKGQAYRLKVVPILGREALQHCEINGDCIMLYARKDATKENKKAILYSWYKEQFAPIIQQMIEKWEQSLNVKLDSYEIRQMKSRWGTCYKNRRKALFNLQLAKKPLNCVEYVVAHELAHLIEPNHSERFKRILDIHFPQWKIIRKELNEFPI